MKTITLCRACDGTDLQSVLDLGKQPLANGLLTDAQVDLPEAQYPLHLVRCLTCGLVQLDAVVDPTVLYGPHYTYRSGVSAEWRNHCRHLAEEIGEGKTVLDIGCLDGVLLSECKKMGCRVVGCDPSGTHPDSVKEFFGRDTRLTKFDVIVVQNVIAHVDDVRGFLEGIRENLTPGGLVVIECPWVVPLIRDTRWDTIYHEHLSYWGVGSLSKAAAMANLDVVDVRYFPEIHGGTMRFYLKRPEYREFGIWSSKRSPAVLEAIAEEESLTDAAYRAFQARVGHQIRTWELYFQNPQRRTLAGYGASAKGATFLNSLWVRPPLVGIFDDTPSKQGLYTPGWHYPILYPSRESMEAVEELICLAPNWATALEKRARELGFTGTIRGLW